MATIQLQYRRDTAANWTGNNVVLAAGEPGYETDTGKFKIGDGTTAWTSLNYYTLSPAGSNTQVQFNDSSVVNATAGFTFNKTSNNVNVANTVNAASFTIGSSFIANSTQLVHTGSANVATLSIGVAAPTAYVHIKAGAAATSSAPLKFTSGTNLTTPEAGAVEYDGTIVTITPSTSYGRAAIPLTVYTSGNGTSTGITGTTAYPIFPAAQDTITLPVGAYLVTMGVRVAVSNTTTSGTCGIDIRGTGTAVGNFSWRGQGAILDSSAASSFAVAATTLGTSITATAASTANPRQYIMIGQGILKITTSGTIIPSIQYSATLTNGVTAFTTDNFMILQTMDTQSAAAYGPAGSGWA